MLRSITSYLGLAAGAAAAALAASAGRGAPPAPPAPTPGAVRPAEPQASVAWTAAGRLPASVGLVLAADRPAEHLNGEAGQSLLALAEDLGLLRETIAGWRSLSRSVGLNQAEALRALLGRRVLLVCGPGTGVEGSELGPWVVATEVDAPAAERLRRRLRAVPRSVAGGVPLLAVEDGRFEAVELPAGFDDASSRADGVRTVVVARAEDRALLLEVVRALRGEPGGSEPRLASLAEYRRLASAEGSVRILARADAGHAEEGAGGVIAASASARGRSWEIAFQAPVGVFGLGSDENGVRGGGRGGAGELIGPEEWAAFEALAAEAEFAAVGWLAAPPGGVGLARLVSGALPLDAEGALAEAIGGRGVVAIEADRAEEGVVLRLTVLADAPPGAAGAGGVDRQVAALLARVPRDPRVLPSGAVAGRAEPVFGGAVPGAVRVHAFPVRAVEGLEGVVGTAGAAAWAVMDPAVTGGDGRLDLALALEAGHRASGRAESAASAVRRILAAARTGSEGGIVTGWGEGWEGWGDWGGRGGEWGGGIPVGRGVARPKALAEALTPAGGASERMPGAGRAGRWVERAEWAVWLDERGGVQGRIEVELADR